MGGRQSKTSVKATVAQHIQRISADDFMVDVIQANELASAFADSQGNKLHFSIKDPDSLSEGALFHQLPFICVLCARLSKEDDLIQQRQLSVPQFYMLFFRLKDNFSSDDFHQTLLLALPPSEKSLPGGKEGKREAGAEAEAEAEAECIICMSEPADIILPCIHSYCQHCIEQWSLTSSECPMCRRHFDQDHDAWVIASHPSPKEMANEIHEFAVSLPEEELEEEREEDE